MFFCIIAALMAWAAAPPLTQSATPLQPPRDAKPASPTLEDVPYPYPVQYLPLTMYGHDVRMAYMDVPAAGAPNGRAVVLLHGMNFYGEYWAHIKAKTLEIGGDKDGPNFPELAKHVADTIPDCRLVLIPNVGHVPHFEAPDVFHRELVAFLKAGGGSTAQK